MPHQEAKEFAAKHNMLFAECSSKTGAGIAECVCHTAGENS